jgi:PAP2 superfamily protein
MIWTGEKFAITIFSAHTCVNQVQRRTPNSVRWVPIRMSLKTFVGLFFLFCLLIVLSHFFLDAGIASFLNKQLEARPQLLGPMDYISHISSNLFLMVCAIAVAGWAIYLYLWHSGIDNRHRRFFQLISIAVPVAFLLKSFLQDVFGAPCPGFWLQNPGKWGFHWFAGAGHLNAFPSGHMTVLTPLIIALGRFYPRYRYVFLALWLALAGALIVTNSHFLSDVIAGAYFGFLMDFYTRTGLSLLSGSTANGQ